MKKRLLLLLFSFSFLNQFAQVFDVDTLLYNGDPDRYINIVIVPDGYRQQEFGKLANDANNIKQVLFDEEPYKSYKNYFNLFLIKVPSNESGVNHPKNANDESSSQNVPIFNIDNYFKSTFDRNGIHRLIGPKNPTDVTKFLVNNIPQYDFIIMPLNTPYYGGAGGGGFAIISNNSAYMGSVLIHELGHGLGILADEYFPETGLREAYNATTNSNQLSVKWKEWLGINNIGIYGHCCGTGSNLWYKPSTTCVMETTNTLKYCNVCREGVIEQIHIKFNPLKESSPSNSNPIYVGESGTLTFKAKIIQPLNPTLKTWWTFSGDIIAGNGIDSITINLSDTKFQRLYNDIIFHYVDTNTFLKDEDHYNGHTNKIKWVLQKDCKAMNIIPYEDTIVCEGSVIKINNTYPSSKYWSTYDTTSSIFVVADKNKELWTFINDEGYTCYDTIKIRTIPFVNSLSKDTILCEGLYASLTDKLNPIALDSTIKRRWFTGDTSKTINTVVDTATNYWISFTQNNTICYDTLKIKASPKINTSPIMGPTKLKPNEKGVYRVDSSSNYFNWYVTNAYLTMSQYQPIMEIMAKNSGQIELKVIEKNSYCSDSSELLINIVKPSGIDENTQKNAPVFYPNPSQGILLYDLKNLAFNSFILSDLTGKVVLNYKLPIENFGTIDISTLPNGVYKLSLIGDENTLTYKILISK